MKVLKDSQHSLLARTFGLRGTRYLVLSVVLLFDLTAPDGLLTEQELWKVVSTQLGKTPFDPGFPKTRGEALLAGSCHAPRQQRVQALNVSLSVGRLHKRIDVFGPRFWKKTAGLETITEPMPFESVSLTWENAFGGKEFSKNPKGRGLDPVLDEDGRQLWPLPLLEDPAALIGDGKDEPDPAGFMPLAETWPQRAQYCGTYDEKWQQEVLPDLPEDFDPLFFNAAPQELQLPEGYFQGGEEYYLEHMHPDERRIRGRLPAWRVRCFVTRQRLDRQGRPTEQVFQDLEMNLDTVWFFPEALRGALVFRGICETLDEEYSDVLDVFVAHEPSSEQPKPRAYYRQERDKALERKMEVDTAPFEKAEQKADRMLQKARLLPKDLQNLKSRLQGKAPRMPRSVQDTSALTMDMLGKRAAGLEAMESMLAAMRSRFGASMPAGVEGKASSLRSTLDKARQHMQGAAERSAARQKQSAATVQEYRETLKKSFPRQELQQQGIDPDSIMVPEKGPPWQEQGFPFVVASRKRLQRDAGARQRLQAMGFVWGSLKRHWVGINAELREDPPHTWGLEEAAGTVRLPPGLVLPRFRDAELCRIQLRESQISDGVPKLEDLENARRDLLVPGSAEEPLFLPAASPSDQAHEGVPMLVVPDELQAILAEQEAGDLCDVLVLASPQAAPGKEAAAALKSAKPLLLLPEGTEPQTALALWGKVLPGAQALVLPRGRTLMEAFRLGVRLRPWILDALPPSLAQGQGSGITLPQKDAPPTGSPTAGLTLPQLDIKSFVADASREARAAAKGKGVSLDAGREEMLSSFRKGLADTGLDPDELLRPPASEPMAPSGSLAEEVGKQALLAAGMFTSMGDTAQAEAFKAKAQEVKGLGAKLEALKARSAEMRGQARDKLARARAGEMPEKAAERLQQAGIDPSDLKRLTREEVLQRLRHSQGLARCDISGLDLSGLDMHGVDFREAACIRTRFAKAELGAADFSRALLREADFSEADMPRVRLDKAVCSKAVFKKAFLRGAQLTETDLGGADLEGAELSEAVLERAACIKGKARGADFSSCRASMVLFSQVDFTGATFENAALHRCMLVKCTLDSLNLRRSTCERTVFQGCSGRQVACHQANMDHVRFVGQTRLPGAVFDGAGMRQAFCKQSHFSQAAFRGAQLDEAVFEDCAMTGCQFRDASAKRARFPKSDLERASFVAANLFLGSLRKARVVETDFSLCNLFGVDFYKAVLGSTRFRGANLKRTLLWKRMDLIE